VPPIHLLPYQAHPDAGGVAGTSPAPLSPTLPDRPPEPTVPLYRCPVYKTTARAGSLSTTGVSTNFILAVDLPSPRLGVQAWVQRGVAIVCDLSE
jgi:hypothetical protein